MNKRDFLRGTLAMATTALASGTLRAAINLGNPILANKDASGQPYGVSVDLARELEQVTYAVASRLRAEAS